LQCLCAQDVESLVAHISAESAEVEVAKKLVEADEAVAAAGMFILANNYQISLSGGHESLGL